MSYYKFPSDDTLDACLSILPADKLRLMVRWLKVAKPQPTRKAEMVKAIKKNLTKRNFRQWWQQLNEIEQLTVSEVLYSDSRIYFPDRIEAKYRKVPKVVGKSYGENLILPLRFFLYSTEKYDYGPATLIIPLDLTNILHEIIPPPPETKLAGNQDIPEYVERTDRSYSSRKEKAKKSKLELIVRATEHAAFHDLYSVLRLIGLDRISVSAKTGRTSAVSIKRISNELYGGDYFETEAKKNSWEQAVGPIKAFAWPWLMQVGNLASINGSKLSLTKTGKAALDTGAAKTLRHLWEKWLNNTKFDEFSRIDEIKGQFRGKGRRSMTSVLSRRKLVASALHDCPVGEWIKFEDFSRYMRAAGLEFEVTNDPWKLYIGEPRYGSLGYSDCHDWELLQGRYILCLLFEYVSTLGMIDIAYTHPHHAKYDFTKLWGASDLVWLSQYDGLEYFRLTPLGAYCLGITKEYTPQTAIERTQLAVFPDLRVRTLSSPSTTERLMLETYADVESENVWRLVRNKIMVALESGHNIESLRTFLAERDEQPLPETVEGFLRQLEQNSDALQVLGGAVLIECASAKVAKELAANKLTSHLCQRAGTKSLVIRNQQEKAFRKAVNSLGYGVKLP